ncbi:MAG: hypothetical protein IPJ13_26325 [Saprospiraceae bacterium]|nr:hypothetical protein [Saprospiraceae bacterium]
MTILFDDPEILYFKSDAYRVLEGSLIKISWSVINAQKVSISSIGQVELTGEISINCYEEKFRIIAENSKTLSESELIIQLLPKPKNFRI